MLRIRHSPGYESERRWISSVIFEEFLGIGPVVTEVMSEAERVQITLQGDPAGACLELDDVLFRTPPADWLSERSVPKLPVCPWDPGELCRDWRDQPIPILYSRSPQGPRVRETGSDLHVGFDFFGSVFFLLTRYEELVDGARDRHNRFPATASLA